MSDARYRDVSARADRFADLLSRGMDPHECGEAMGPTKGQTASTWRRIKTDLGPQAR